MTSRYFRPLLRSGLLLFAILAPATASAAQVVGSCTPSKVKFVASSLDGSARTLTTFGNIPEASLGFTQGSAGGCVIVRFSSWHYLGFDGLVVRAFLDNTTAALPAEVTFSSQDSQQSRVHMFEFIFPNVAPGAHIVRMQYKSIGGSYAYVHRHNTIVQYAP